MTKSEQKPKLQIATRKPKAKGDMFANLRTREQIETVPFEDLVTPISQENASHQSQPNPTHTAPAQPNPTQQNTAPSRDFNRRANSLERDALPAGLFPGTSKKLYDALYLRTRGAFTPVRSIQATKRELMAWSGIRSKNTIAINLKILLSVGLIKPDYDPGNHEGSVYEVLLPEELPTQPNPAQLPPTQPNPTQKLGLDPTQRSGWDGSGNHVDSKVTYAPPKTSFKTNTERSDDDAALAGLIASLKQFTKEITGKDLSPTDSDRWKELAEVLGAELKIAAARTTVSSVPAFLAEHLRRRLWKIDKKQARAEGRELPDEVVTETPAVDASRCPDCGGSSWWYPEGESKGVAKCKHEKLTTES
jgi:hypothetical protein